jgi:multidrug efflux pump subunit AcrB
MNEGLSGRIAGAFIRSKLTVLLMIAFLLLGGISTYMIPREEEPQIEVPMADVFVGYPGASPQEVESGIVAPLEKIVSNLHGVEYVYATAMPGQAMLTVQFYVGEDVERSLVKLYNELMKHMDRMPRGVTGPLVKTRAIDDVPVLGLTLWSAVRSDFDLRQLSEVVAGEIKKIPDVATVQVIGGRSRQVKVTLDKDKMAQSQVDFLSVAEMIGASNVQMASGAMVRADQSIVVETGSFLTTADEVAALIVGVSNGQPVYLHQVARVEDGPEEPRQYVSFGYGGASEVQEQRTAFGDQYPAVTLAIAKRKGADAMTIAENVMEHVSHLRKDLIPDEVQITSTRNYGETASEKVSELLFHLFIAIVAVTAFVMLAMGWRGGLVVFLSVPVTFAMTLFAYYFLDYTLNRITLFALVFVTGIVVDDSIIIAENMHRHFKMRRLPFLQAAIYAINEVGNPTILATFTVIAAVLPMAFVSGMMGPYMSPMPIGASIAMLMSLLVALTLTPYLGYLFLREKSPKEEANPEPAQDAEGDSGEVPEGHGVVYRIYSAVITPFLESRAKRWGFMLGTVVALLLSLLLFLTNSVSVKMLPFDNKNELQVVIDMPEGTTLERTAAVTREMSLFLSAQELVTHYQEYVGTASPITFNGLVRHYDLRSGAHVADIHVNLVDKKNRKLQSHDVAKMLRPGLVEIATRHGANVKVVEVPPGPPVLSTIVAEIYGPDYEQQKQIALQVRSLFGQTQGVVDVDWMTEEPQTRYMLDVDKEKAARSGVMSAQVVASVQAALSGMPAGTLHRPSSVQQIPIVLRLDPADRSGLADLNSLTVVGRQGNAVPIGDIASWKEDVVPQSIYRKNQKRVVYVVADMAGDLESPVYAMSDISSRLSELTLPSGYTLTEAYSRQPDTEDNFVLKWDGEWQITYEVFRDLGIAFLLVLILIYVLIVGWFQKFSVPLVMLTAIPLSLIGILVGHWIMGAYFTATSMIGFIALAGVMVRNSVLLIDFIDIRLQQRIPLKQAIVEAGAVRTTPILLTAGAVALGAFVILFDPIFQGLAISLMGGTITSTFLTLVVVPLLYYRMMRNKVPS